jgi:hypothetical protein
MQSWAPPAAATRLRDPAPVAPDLFHLAAAADLPLNPPCPGACPHPCRRPNRVYFALLLSSGGRGRCGGKRARRPAKASRVKPRAAARRCCPAAPVRDGPLAPVLWGRPGAGGAVMSSCAPGCMCATYGGVLSLVIWKQRGKHSYVFECGRSGQPGGWKAWAGEAGGRQTVLVRLPGRLAVEGPAAGGATERASGGRRQRRGRHSVCLGAAEAAEDEGVADGDQQACVMGAGGHTTAV